MRCFTALTAIPTHPGGTGHDWQIGHSVDLEARASASYETARLELFCGCAVLSTFGAVSKPLHSLQLLLRVLHSPLSFLSAGIWSTVTAWGCGFMTYFFAFSSVHHLGSTAGISRELFWLRHAAAALVMT